MTFLRQSVFPLAVAVFFLNWARPCAASPDASWLPAHTVGCIAISDLNRYLNDGKETVFGKLLNAEPLKPFFDSVWSTQEKDPFTIPGLLGCTLKQLTDATQGSLVLGLLVGPDGVPAMVLLLDTKDRQDQAQQLLDHLGSCLAKTGAEKTLQANKTIVYTLPDAYALGVARQLICTSQDGYVVIATRQEALQDIVARRPARGANLTGNPNYQATTARALKETPGALLSWYFEPLNYASAWRTLTAAKVVGKDMVKILAKEGFTGLKSFGGAAHIDAKTGAIRVQALVHAPKPYPRALGMLACTEQRLGEPPAWVPRTVSVFGTVANDVPAAFKGFGYLFDGLFGEGEEGVFDDVLRDLKEDSVGPKVDLRKELVERLRAPVTYLQMPPGDKGSSRWLIASPIEQAAGVADAVDRLFKGDKSAHKLAFGEHGLWQVLPEGTAEQGKEKKTDWSLPASALGVHKQLLLFGSAPELVRHVFTHDQPLARDPAYQAMHADLTRLTGQAASLRMFLRMGLLQRETLAELRSEESKPKTMLGSLLQEVIRSGSKRPGKGIDFKNLPSPDDVAAFMGGQGGVSANLTGDTWSMVMILTR